MSDAELWQRWAARWERFQDAYVPHRSLQMRLLAEYIALARPADPLRVLDLCCGCGSAAAELLSRRPGAAVVGVDLDPWMLELGRRTARHRDRITWIAADVTARSWTGRLPGAAFDAVVTTTAMQWLHNDEIRRLYHDVAGLLGAGAVWLSSDALPTGPPDVRRLATEAQQRERERSIAAPGGEDWGSFWADARAEPRFADLLAVRDRRIGTRTPLAGRALSLHERWLHDAGFAEVGEVWRCHETALLLAVRS